MFDVQVLRRPAGDLPDEVLASIAAYYARVTTNARPMNRLVAVAMLSALAAIVVELANGDHPRWAGWASLALTATAVGIAAGHTFAAAVRLGSRRDPVAEQSRLARSICRDHLICLPLIATVIAIQLASA